MRRCEACNVEFSGPLKRCPLCSGDMSGEPSPSVFPMQGVMARPRALALRIMAFICGAALLLMAFFGYVFAWPATVTVAICASLAIGYVFVRNTVAHAPNPLRTVCRAWCVAFLIVAVWLAVVGGTVIPTFVMPILAMTMLTFDAVLMIVMRGGFISQYAKYVLFDIVLACLPLALSWFGLLSWDLLALISALYAGLELLGLLVFTHASLFAELRKLFAA